VIGSHRVNPTTKDDVLASIRLSTLGFVFQAFNLLGSMTAQENVELPITLKGDKSGTRHPNRPCAPGDVMCLGAERQMCLVHTLRDGTGSRRVGVDRQLVVVGTCA
jgi:putative ABC transport system ATP-binding protein